MRSPSSSAISTRANSPLERAAGATKAAAYVIINSERGLKAVGKL